MYGSDNCSEVQGCSAYSLYWLKIVLIWCFSIFWLGRNAFECEGVQNDCLDVSNKPFYKRQKNELQQR